MSPPVAQQIISSMKIIMGEDGTDEGQTSVHQPRFCVMPGSQALNPPSGMAIDMIVFLELCIFTCVVLKIFRVGG